MADVDWFKKYNQLAIADVAWVDGIGLCSHQPGGFVEVDGGIALEFPPTEGKHRMMDIFGNVRFVTSDKLFQVMEGEARDYWRAREP